MKKGAYIPTPNFFGVGMKLVDHVEKVFAAIELDNVSSWNV
jgi:hypothetical protein